MEPCSTPQDREALGGQISNYDRIYVSQIGGEPPGETVCITKHRSNIQLTSPI